MSAGTVYKSTDAGAPVLTSAAGSLNAVLRACLVDGYGAKAAAGWTVILEDNDDWVVFQNNVAGGGIGAAYSVRDDGTDNSGKAAAIKMWESVSNFDSGLNGTAARYICKSNTADATARAWCIVADDKFAYVFVNFDGNSDHYILHYFGDIIPYYANDAYHAVLCANASATTAYYQSGTCGQALTYVLRELTQLGNSATKVLIPGAGMYLYLGGLAEGVSAYPYNGIIYISYPYLAGASGTSTPPRGRLPGLYVFGHINSNFADGSTYTVDSVDYYCVKFWGSGVSPNVIHFDLANFRP